MIDTISYWTNTEVHPAELTIAAREAWHRDAWDREQHELGNLIGNDVTEYPSMGFARIPGYKS